MDLICAIEIGFVKLANKGKRADEIRRKIFGIIKEVGDCRLSIWVWWKLSSENIELGSHDLALQLVRRRL